MADLKISEMTPAAELTGAELIECVQGGVNVKQELTGLKTWVAGTVIRKFATYTEQMAYIGVYADGQKADVLGYLTVGDGGYISMYWDATSTLAHNGGTVRKPTAIGAGAGRWLALDNNNVTVRMFGALGNGTDDDTDAIQAAIDSGALNIFLPEGNYPIRAIISHTTSSFKFIGAGPSTVLTLIGTDADAYSYTVGTSTITSNLMFRGGGEARPYVGNFKVVGNVNISYGMSITQFINGSVTENIWFKSFLKDGAVPITYHNCVSTHAPNLTATDCDRFIRIHGMADAVHFIKPTIYNFNINYAPIFNEVGYLNAGDPTRYTVGTIFDGPYCVQDTNGASSANNGGTFISMTSVSKLVVRDVWPEGVTTSIHLTGCEKAEITGALSYVNSDGGAKIEVTSSYNNLIFSEGVVELSSGCVYNTIFVKSPDTSIVFANPADVGNLVFARDVITTNRISKIAELEATQLQLTSTLTSQSGLATPVSNIMTGYQEGTFTPTFGGGVDPDVITYDEQVGRYQRIGNAVFFNIRLKIATFTLGSGSGEVKIDGLPFYASGGDISGALGETTGWVTSTPLTWRAQNTQSYLNVLVGGAVVLVGNLQVGTTVRFSGFYFVI